MSIRSSNLMSLTKRIRDIAIETLVAVALVAAFVVYEIKTHSGTSRDWTPIVQIGNTALVFGYVISWFRFAWRRTVFWVVIGTLLFGHAAVYVFILGRIEHLPLAYYALLDAIEFALFGRILGNLTAKEYDRTVRSDVQRPD